LIAPGSFSAHMAMHIAAMNVLAPLAAVAWISLVRDRHGKPGRLWLAALAQIGVLWAWHLPAAQYLLAHGSTAVFLAQALLFASALLFWITLLRLDGILRWHGVLALLITGKLFCLLAALLVFAPRTLYGMHDPALDDQQLAGLLMIVACPLSYVLAGVVLAAQLVGLRQPSAQANAQG
jgi:putative membrane protein